MSVKPILSLICFSLSLFIYVFGGLDRPIYLFSTTFVVPPHCACLPTRQAQTDVILSAAKRSRNISGILEPPSDEFSINRTSSPEVTLVEPEQNREFHWGDQVRYRIMVSDRFDGDSRFGEIKPMEVLLETRFIQEMNDLEKSADSDSLYFQEHEGLTLLRKSTCFSCHADKSRLVGPSFSDISSRYSSGPESLSILANSIVNGSSGKWDEFEMPPNSGLSIEEAEKITKYILSQGSNKHSRVYPGLEGIFRVIDQPEGTERGFYVLTASYTNNAPEMARGQDTIVIEIR